MSELKKIYRGSYDYLQGETIYATENFDIFRSDRDNFFKIVANIFSRVVTGELITINVEYFLSSKFSPEVVTIMKTMGNYQTHEIFAYEKEQSQISYQFNSSAEERSFNIPAKLNYHVATPSTAASLMFYKSKKFNATSKNNYYVVTSNNEWEYINNPTVKNITLERVRSTKDSIKIGEALLESMLFKMGEDDNDEETKKKKKKKNNKNNQEYITVHMSNHMGIPYLVETNNIKVRIKFLNNLDDNY